MEELHAAGEGSGTRMPPTGAQAHEDQGNEVAQLSLRDRPIDLVDIARMLGASANVERPGAPVRDWRDDLTLIRESLGYARAVLTADVAILSQPASPGATGPRDVVDELPGVLTAGPGASCGPPALLTRTSIRTSTRTSSSVRITCWPPTGRWPG